MRENSKRILSFSAAVLSAFTLTAPSGLGAAPRQTPTEPQVLSNAVANKPVQFDVSPPLAQLLTAAPAQPGFHVTHAPLLPKLQPSTFAPLSQGTGAAAALQPLVASPNSATVGLSFEGVGNTATLSCPSVIGHRYAPPD